MNIQILHSLHSSIVLLPNGACGEIRRGSLYYFDIPNPMIWSSIQDWQLAAPRVRNYYAEFPQPPYWTMEQYAFSQWFHESTLWYDTDAGWLTGDSVVFVKTQLGYMIPVFMDLATGIMNIKGQNVCSFAETGIQCKEIWRMETGDLYRVV